MKNTKTNGILDLISSPVKQSFTTSNGKTYDYYISGEIDTPDQYSDWFHTIRNIAPEETIVLHINSQGGDLFTAIQFVMAIQECQGHVIASVEGMCMSAATMIFLVADEFRITPYSMFMFHNYSGGTYGKGGEMFDALNHERKWSDHLLRSVYHNFLSYDEISSLLENKDIWMDTDEVISRLQSRMEKNGEKGERTGKI